MSWRPRRFDRSFGFAFMWTWSSTARRMRFPRSSGVSNFVPFARMVCVTVFPVASRTFGTAYWSRRRSPTSADERPCVARRTTVSSISSGSRGTHSGLFAAKGRLEPDRPFRRAWMRAIVHPKEGSQERPRIYGYPSGARPLRGLDEERGVIPLVRIELRHPERRQPEGRELRADARVHGFRFGGDVRAPRLDHEEAEPAGAQETEVLAEDADLVPLRDVLVQDRHGAHDPLVRLRLVRVREDRNDVVAALGEVEQFLERAAGDLHRVHRAVH